MKQKNADKLTRFVDELSIVGLTVATLRLLLRVEKMPGQALSQQKVPGSNGTAHASFDLLDDLGLIRIKKISTPFKSGPQEVNSATVTQRGHQVLLRLEDILDG